MGFRLDHTLRREGLGSGASKLDGLLRLLDLGLPVPAFGALDGRELDSLDTDGSLSDAAKSGLRDFVRANSNEGHPPLFALRFDCKMETPDRRPPITLLNVGLRALDAKRLLTASGASIPSDRLQKLEQGRQFTPVEEKSSAGPEGELIAAAEQCLRQYRALFPNARTCDLIVQRMVFAIASGVSGNGICCNYPECHGADRLFKGVYLPDQQGIQLRKGAWGTPQVPLSDLLHIHAPSHAALRKAHASASKRFGPNPYFEFTIEAGTLYFLQHQERERFVAHV
jgi:hypothetical protein